MRRLFVGFVVLLVASHAVRALRGSSEQDASPLGPGVESVLLDDARGGGERIRIAYRDEGPREADTTPILMLHGSPGSHSDFRSLAGALATERRTLAVDLPGFGASTRSVDDYSVRAHARDMERFLDALGLERAHVVGFSMGGGVAIELAALRPERVASLTLLAAIGVQELELLGDYHLNHGVHGLQLAGLWAVYELVPHFGLLDGGMLSLAYARNFYDTDQRPLREHLEHWSGPTLILHGRDDVLVPFAAATEHHRIVPQSRLEVFDANHFFVFSGGDSIAERMRPFLAAVEAGEATTRADADAERLEQARQPFDPRAVGAVTGFALFLLLAIAAAATLVSEDLTCIAVGALVGQGRIELLPGALACFVGIYVGDILLFLAGRVLGRRALGRAPWRYFLTEARVERSSIWFRERGPFVIFLSRFLPGMRLPTYFASGVLRTSFWSFSLWFALAAAIWTPLLVWLSSRIGGALGDRLDFLQANLARTLLVTVAIVFVLVKLVRPMASHRGRRLLLSRWCRLTRWEYWPRWAFYPPIACACVGYAIQRRCAFAFAAANPAIPHGGFVGESKAEILRGLSGEPEWLAKTLVLETAEEDEGDAEAATLAVVDEFRLRHGLDWPLVVKPDVGQRGEGVSIVRDSAELLSAVDQLAGRVLVQEFVAGDEFGAFYARRPSDETGRLISIARKVPPELVGDGEHTLERLILDDDRALCMATHFFDRHAARLDTVPEAGERVVLGELGTHCLGAAFLEGGDLATPELEGAIERVSRGFDGFWFGRFDVRAESEAELRAGRFKILELNGVTSESAHVYDPRYSVFDGWRTIAAQWKLAYEIGAQNLARGAKRSRLRDLVRSYRAYRRVAATGARPAGAHRARRAAFEIPERGAVEVTT